MQATTIPGDIASLSDYERYAREALNDQAWAYISGASADEYSARRNERAYGDICLLNRTLVDVSRGTTSLSLLNETLAHPILLAPVAYQKLAHPDGELASAAAAAAQDALFVLSTLASSTIEDVASISKGPKWFQLYFQADHEQTLALIRRAEAHGYSAIVVTVDAPVNGLRNREQRSGFRLPDNVRAVNCQPEQNGKVQAGESMIFQGLMSRAPTWKDVRWLKAQTRLPVIIKGVINPADVGIALGEGVDGLIISNHGGRTLDTLPSPVEVLPTIAALVDKKIPLIVDSGIRRGTDIFKAIALGADAVMIGRPVMYGLATAGAMGVAHTLRLLRDELELTMALCGCETLGDISPACLWQPARQG